MAEPVHELRILVAHRSRTAGRVADPWNTDLADPPLEAIEAAAAKAPSCSRWVLIGGEPTLRGDLPQIIEQLAGGDTPPLTVRTDGLALTSTAAPQTLASAGLDGVRIPLFSGRSDAHDWLMNLAGSCQAARRAIDQCLAVLPRVEVEIPITRPTMPYLTETVALLVRAGVQHLRFRLPPLVGHTSQDSIALVARLGLLQAYLQDAVQTALRHERTVQIEGIPLCVVPDHPGCCCPGDAIHWAIPDGAAAHPAFRQSAPAPGCSTCPGPPACPGAPAGYTERFGWAEISSEGDEQHQSARVRPSPPPASGDPVAPPPPRAGRNPETRVAAAVRQAERISLGGDPMSGRKPLPERPDTLRVQFGEAEPTRNIRQRLVRAAQHGATTLRIDGNSLAHPTAPELLREALRLSFERVEVAGPAHHLAGCTDAQLFHLRGIARFDVVLHGADAATHDQQIGEDGSFAAALAVAERMQRLTDADVGVLAAPSTSDSPEAFEAAWSAGVLPPLANAPIPAPLCADTGLVDPADTSGSR